jgi:hypothetical protein
MFIVRDIFHLQFGRYREAKQLIDEGLQSGQFPKPQNGRILTDFTGEGYRLILEQGFDTLAAFETDLARELGGTGWKEWYEKFKILVRYSEREILKQVG